MSAPHRRPSRLIDEESVRRLARYAGLPLPEERLEGLADLLSQHLADVRAWEKERLGFWFEEGTYSVVKPEVLDRVAWSFRGLPEREPPRTPSGEQF